MYTGIIDILCTTKKSHYLELENVRPWNQDKDAYNYNDSTPVITHAPCGQWSKLKSMAHCNEREKQLAPFCLDKVNTNGGIFEHPDSSDIWKQYDISKGQLIEVWLSWFGFEARKRTFLYFVKCKPITMPISFNAWTNRVSNMSARKRETTPKAMAEWLVQCIRETYSS